MASDPAALHRSPSPRRDVAWSRGGATESGQAPTYRLSPADAQWSGSPPSPLAQTPAQTLAQTLAQTQTQTHGIPGAAIAPMPAKRPVKAPI